jgi:hypothetical protein
MPHLPHGHQLQFKAHMSSSEAVQGKIALVTGVTSNVGRAIAEAFAAEGAHVAVSGRSAERGKQVVDEIRARGSRADFVQADLDGSAAASKALAISLTSTEGADSATSGRGNRRGDQGLARLSADDGRAPLPVHGSPGDAGGNGRCPRRTPGPRRSPLTARPHRCRDARLTVAGWPCAAGVWWGEGRRWVGADPAPPGWRWCRLRGC